MRRPLRLLLGRAVAALLAAAAWTALQASPAFAEELHKVSFTESPRGAFSIDKYGNAVGNVMIRKCEKKGNELVNTVVKTYPNTSQFWTYGDEAFLKNPVYSRDFPPAKNLE